MSYLSTMMNDIGSLVGKSTTGIRPEHTTSREKANELSMTDFLNLMIVQLQNQSIDSNTDTSDMLNQMVQMQTIQSLTNITDATMMMYAGSLVGKDVTVGEYNEKGELTERVLTITGTGYSNGEQVLFAGNEVLKLSDIMAVGRLPEIEKPDETEKPGDKPGDVEKPDEPGDTEHPDEPGDVEKPDGSGETEGGDQKPDDSESELPPKVEE